MNFGKEALYSLQNSSRAPCGYAAIADVRSGRLDDRMDSYFLSETLMYLYLLFDEVCNHGKKIVSQLKYVLGASHPIEIFHVLSQSAAIR